MKRILIAALIAAGPAFADPSPFLKGDELQAEVKKLCSDGCIVFSPAEVEELQKSLMQKAVQDMTKAYEQGRKQGGLSCRNAL